MNNSNSSKKETMKEETNKSIFKIALEETLHSKNHFPTHLFIFVAVTLVSLIIAYIFPFSLVLTVPFVIIPAYFSYSSVQTVTTKKHLPASFMVMFKHYFSRFFLGGYRLLTGFLKSFLGYLVTQTGLMLIFEPLVFSKIDAYKALMNKYENSLNLEEFAKDYAVVIETSEMKKYLFIISLTALLVATCIFIQHIARNSIKMRRNLFIPEPFPMRTFTPIEKKVIKEHRKEWFKSYFYSTWFIQVLVILFGVGGGVFSFFFLKDYDYLSGYIIMLFAIMIVLLFFANYINNVQDAIYIKFMPTFEETYVNMTLEFISKYKDKINVSDEDLQKIQDFLNNKKEGQNKTQQDTKEEPEQKEEINKEDENK